MTKIGQHRRHTGPSNRGEATLPVSATSVAITHGLVHKPRIVLCNPALDLGDCWITNVNCTNFTFNCDTGIAALCAVYWYVE